MSWAAPITPLVQASFSSRIVLASPTGNRIGEVDPTTGAVLNSFEIPPGYTVNFGDLDVCSATGNLLLISSDENSIRELTPDGTLVDDHPLPTVIPGLSGIALIGDSGQAWVSTLNSSILRLDGIPCAVPEPGVATGLLIGALQLALLRRRGGRNSL
jgi:hypothetical protein